MVLVAPIASGSRWSPDLLNLDESWGDTPPSIEKSLAAAPIAALAPSAPPPVLPVEPVSGGSARSWQARVDTIPPWPRKRRRTPILVALATLVVGAGYCIAQSETPKLDDSTPFTDSLVPANVAPAAEGTDPPYPAFVSIAINLPPTRSHAKRGTPSTKGAAAQPAIDPGVATSGVSNDRPAQAAVPTTTPVSTGSSDERPPPGEFDAKAASYALSGVEGTVLGCKREDDPSGAVVVIVTYAPSGHVTSASVSTPPYAGTFTGSCIERAVRRATIPAFEGDSRTVSKSYRLR